MITFTQAVRELYNAIYGSNSTNFHASLYRLIQKADAQNRKLLRLAYPLEVQAWEEWQSSPDEREFFAEFGLAGKEITS